MNKISKWFKKYFIPHEHNDWKPHFLRHKSMMFFLLVILLAELGFLVQVFIVFDKTNFLASVLPGVLTTLTNQERAQNNAPPLTENALLSKAAKMKAEDMANLGYFAHTSPEGKTPWYWFDQVGYRYTMAGENLAVNFFESDDVAQAWMNSPTHRANVVKKDYTEIGIGVAQGVYEGRNTVFVAELFGTPLSIASAENIPPFPAKLPVQETKITTVPSPTPKKTTTIKKAPAPAPKTQPVTPVLTNSVPPTTVAVAPQNTQILGEESTGTNVVAHSTSAMSYVRSFIQRVLTSPRQYLSYVYGGISLVIILSLLLVMFIRREMKHPAILLPGLAVMTAIAVLLFFNINLLDFNTSVDPTEASASAIESVAY